MQAIELKPHSLVRIIWSDSSFVKGWHYPPYEFGEPLREIETVGWVVQTDDTHVVLAGSHSNEGGVLCPTFVPWGIVSQVQVLKSGGEPDANR